MLRTHIRMSIGLGVLALIAMLFSALALTDIAHGEADTRMEWATVRGSAAVLLMFIAQALVTLVRTRKFVGSR